MKRVVFWAIFLGVLAFTVFIWSSQYGVLAQSSPTPPSSSSTTSSGTVTPLHVAASDLEKAGFTNVTPELPQASGRFKGPTDYFAVGDRVESASSEAPNIVMVDSDYYIYADAFSDSALFTYGSDSHPLTIPGGTGKEGTLSDGRIAVSFIKGNNYTVIIGPNKQKIETLALAVVNKVK